MSFAIFSCSYFRQRLRILSKVVLRVSEQLGRGGDQDQPNRRELFEVFCCWQLRDVLKKKRKTTEGDLLGRGGGGASSSDRRTRKTIQSTRPLHFALSLQ